MDKDFFLVRKMKNGDEKAMECFVRQYYPVILQYCRYRIRDREDAKDITQETFERFFGKLTDYRYMGKTVNYLYVIAGNLCRDFYQKKTVLVMEELPEQEENPMEEISDRMDIEIALEKLPEELKEIIILYYFQDRKLKEIAEITETLSKAKEAFYEGAKLHTVSRMEFLFHQMRYIKKWWWLCQAMVLVVLWRFLYSAGSDVYMQRIMGVLAAVFAILLVPELWKNRSSQSMEIEGTAYFSLRQVYAARMLLFAMADVLMLSVFCGVVSVTAQITVKELLFSFFRLM